MDAKSDMIRQRKSQTKSQRKCAGLIQKEMKTRKGEIDIMVTGMLVILGFAVLIIGTPLYCIYRIIRKYWKDRSYKKYWKEFDERKKAKDLATKEVICPYCGSLLLANWYYSKNVCCNCNSEFDVYAAMLIKRARNFLKKQKYEDSRDCYNKILAVHPDSQLMLDEIRKIDTAKEDHVFIRATVFNVFSKYETIEFKMDYMIYLKNNGKCEVYKYDKMDDIKDDKNTFFFSYGGNIVSEGFTTSIKGSLITSFIECAKRGLYPPLECKPN